MPFEYTDPDGDHLSVFPLPGQDVAFLIESPRGAACAVHLPVDLIEDLVAGVRDMARQAAAPSACGCGKPEAPGTVHRPSAPCYVDEPATRTAEEAAAAEVHVQPARYEVSVLPVDDPNRRHFTLYVEWRGADRWAVATGFHDCLSSDGTWSHEPRPSERDDEWIGSHRFDLDTALALAKEHAPHITVNGHTALDALRATTDEETW